MKHDINLKVNGDVYALQVESRRTLLEVLREQLGLTGTKEMCNKGDCGGCTVLLDGRAVLSCMMLAVEADGKEILTIEGLAGKGTSSIPFRRPSWTMGPSSVVTAHRASSCPPRPCSTETWTNP